MGKLQLPIKLENERFSRKNSVGFYAKPENLHEENRIMKVFLVISCTQKNAIIFKPSALYSSSFYQINKHEIKNWYLGCMQKRLQEKKPIEGRLKINFFLHSKSFFET